MKIDGLTPQQLLQVLTKSSLVSLNAGDVIQGRVVSVENGMLLLNLLDGSQFSARLPEGLQVSQGALLTLQIGEKVQDRLTARIVNPDPSAKNPQQNTEDSLTAQIKTQLDNMGSKTTDEMVAKVLDLLDKNSSLGVEKASFLAANRMDSDNDMQSVMMKLAQKEFQIDKNLLALKDIIISSLIDAKDPAAVKSLLNPIALEQELEGLSEKVSALVADGQNVLNEEASKEINLKRSELGKAIQNALKSSLAQDPPPDDESLVTALKTAINSFKDQKGLILKDKALEDSLNEIIRGMAKTEKGSGFTEKEIKQLVQRVFDKAFIKVSDEVKEPLDLNEKVEALKTALQFANDASKMTDSKAPENHLPVVRELQNAISFFNQVQTYHTFVQLPLVINRKNTTGELYIMRQRTKRGKIDPNNFTLFISLNTQNLGLVETFLNASNRYVTISFRVSDDNLVKFIRDHHRDLYESLAGKGYKLAEMKCRIHEDDPVNLINAASKTEEILGMKASVDLKI